ncbi:MAG: glycosyltransferase family 2 protein [Rubrobacteridae bacterium]|nr:glycosyltransferase family 2 protein [Rubrobacteridae bacterium]
MSVSNNNTTVVALVAAYNEADRIAETIEAIFAVDTIDRVLVVDDGSTDDTSSIAKATGADVIELPKNVGKGSALQAAMESVSEDIVLFLDADLGECASEAKKLLEPVLKDAADMAIADFPKAKTKGGLGFAKGLGRWGIHRFTGVSMNEPLSGQRAVKANFLRGVRFEKGYGLEVGMTVDILKKGCNVVEIPVIMTHRETGRDLRGILHRGKQFRDILGVIIKRILTDI